MSKLKLKNKRRREKQGVEGFAGFAETVRTINKKLNIKEMRHFKTSSLFTV